jgi:DNA-binding NarL/FixJ family response regulator
MCPPHPIRSAEYVRILLANDHPSFQDFVQDLLEPAFEIVGKVQNGRSLLEAVLNLKPDVIVTGIEMPILIGLDAVWNRTNAGWHAKVIVLTIDSDLNFVRSALAAGASGFVAKHRAAIDLIPAIQAVRAGDFFVSPQDEVRIDL